MEGRGDGLQIVTWEEPEVEAPGVSLEGRWLRVQGEGRDGGGAEITRQVIWFNLGRGGIKFEVIRLELETSIKLTNGEREIGGEEVPVNPMPSLE